MRGLKDKNILPLSKDAEPPFRAMFDAMAEALLAINGDGKIFYGNHSAQALTGMGEKGLAGKALADILGDANPVAGALKAGRGIAMRDVTLLGREVTSISLMPIEGGNFLLSVSYETVPLKNAWVSRIQRNLKSAQHMARMLAHEIKNPLSGIRGAAQLLGKSGLKPDDAELATLIENEAQRIARLVDKVNVFDDAPHEYETVNLHEVLEQVHKSALAGFASQVSIVKKYDPSLPGIRGHYDSLVQAMLNLVKNAAEAGGREIVIRSWYDTAAGFHPESRERLPVCVAIEDNGAGIDPAIREHLFEPYRTTKPKGEGLGLSIVSKIIDDHGGVAEVASMPGKTVFKLSFPRGDKQ